MVSLLILEDVKALRESIRTVVSEIPFIDNVFDTGNPHMAIKIAKEHVIDIAVFDIELKNYNINGIDTAKYIMQISSGTHFIFLTAYENYAIQAFQVHPYNYLIKPLNIYQLRNTILELLKKYYDQSDVTKYYCLVIKTNNDILKINYDDILFIEKNQSICTIHLRDREYEVSKTLSSLADQLGQEFFLAHRGFIINLNKVIEIHNLGNRSYIVKFKDTHKTALMSRYQYDKFKSALGV